MKNIISFVLIMLTFLFFPKENRWFLFHSSKVSYYGEMYMMGDDEKYIIAKNISDNTVYLKKNIIKSNISKQIDNEHYFKPDSTQMVFPNSYSIISIADSNKTNMERNYDNNYRFIPLPLAILTNAEKEYLFIIFILVSFLIGWLVYIITLFAIKSKKMFSYE